MLREIVGPVEASVLERKLLEHMDPASCFYDPASFIEWMKSGIRVGLILGEA
jgi:hypothetical protein